MNYENSTQIESPKIKLNRINPYLSEILHTYNSIIKTKFTQNELHETNLENIQNQYEQLKIERDPKLATVFYIHALSNKQIPFRNRLKLANKISNKEILPRKEAQRELNYLILKTKEQTLGNFTKKLYEKEKQLHKSNQDLEKKLQIQKLAKVLKLKIEDDLENNLFYSPESYKLGF